jgi:hypothetical protein
LFVLDSKLEINHFVASFMAKLEIHINWTGFMLPPSGWMFFGEVVANIRLICDGYRRWNRRLL